MNDTTGRTVNKVILVGAAGSDPDVRNTGSGRIVAHLSLATNRITDSLARRTEWHRVTFWDGLAEMVEREVRRGTRLFVEGHIEYGSYDRDGLSIPTADIVASDAIILNGKEG